MFVFELSRQYILDIALCTQKTFPHFVFYMKYPKSYECVTIYNNELYYILRLLKGLTNWQYPVVQI